MSAKPGLPVAKEQSGVLTQSQLIRLECLRLVFNPAKDAQYLITKALELEHYVSEGSQKGTEVWVLTHASGETDRQDDPNAPI
ncbi:MULTISPECIES: hypothetical protein [Paraburkholderia]|uniref:hypothetical protein n=1 Tax=Paraburkholderia TaxID=1822464 RepID=UPI002252C397|nr:MULTISPECIES: hypothetical protein [Paraburkholderia]MCX4154992.1 hypothetical protein [Paraburkholderia aspalathi]MDN7164402.1 hypothetical protein [Paraburkholderia sp. SECH2]MDQ6392887.1 hypothetical protein [Paraburkholderia aspalathi]